MSWSKKDNLKLFEYDYFAPELFPCHLDHNAINPELGNVSLSGS